MIIEANVKIAKETNDIMNLLVETIVVVKTKGDYTSLLDELIAAISGADQIDDEAKESLAVVINTVGGRAGDIAMALTAKKEEVVTEEVK